jgi:hypothetical protein
MISPIGVSVAAPAARASRRSSAAAFAIAAAGSMPAVVSPGVPSGSIHRSR